jgi:hypothetical protein
MGQRPSLGRDAPTSRSQPREPSHRSGAGARVLGVVAPDRGRPPATTTTAARAAPDGGGSSPRTAWQPVARDGKHHRDSPTDFRDEALPIPAVEHSRHAASQSRRKRRPAVTLRRGPTLSREAHPSVSSSHLGEYDGPRAALTHAGRRAPTHGNGRQDRAATQRIQLRSEHTRASRAPQLHSDAEALEIHATCLRNSLQPRSSPMCPHSSSAWRPSSRTTSRGWAASPPAPRRRPREVAEEPGRPRHPRPTTTPAAPVCPTMASASRASQMSPVAEHGDVDVPQQRRWRPSRRCPSRPARPSVRGGRSRRRRSPGRSGRVEVGQVVLVDALCGSRSVTGTSYGSAA